MKTKSYLGIDLSLRNAGIAIINDNTVHTSGSRSTRAIYTTLHTEPSVPHLTRVRYLTNTILAWAKAADVVVLEDYAFGASGSAVHQISELTGILKWRLLREAKVTPLLCNIRTLKKFITGSGKATKGQMGKALREIWGIDFRDFKNNGKRGKLMDGEADAYSLALLARCFDAYHSGFDIREAVLSKDQIKILSNLKERW